MHDTNSISGESGESAIRSSGIEQQLAVLGQVLGTSMTLKCVFECFVHSVAAT